MPTITKRGETYRIRAYCGYDAKGKQVTRSTTWKPAPGMTPKQIEKELQRQAVLFEEKCSGQGWGGSIKFETFCKQWFEEYAAPSLRPRSIARLHQLEVRTYAALGHVRLDKLTPRQIQTFINDLGKPGISQRESRSRSKVDLPALLAERDMLQKDFAPLAGLSRSTVSSACRGEYISLQSAKKFAKALGRDYNTLFETTAAKVSLSPKTIRNYHGFVSSVLSYAVRMGMIQHNPAQNVTLPHAERKEKECYSLEEAQTFLESLESAPTKYRAFFVLAIYGGFRRGELLGLEWPDLDFETCVVSIRRTSQYLKEKGVFTDTTKTVQSQRSLKLPAVVFDVLRQHRAAQAQERLLLGDQWHDSQRLFVNAFGEPMHPNTPYHWLKGFCQETGQRFLGVHQFRHLNASLLINSGADVRTVSASLGHSQVTTTLNIYAHTFAEAQAKAGEAVAAALDLGNRRKAKGSA